MRNLICDVDYAANCDMRQIRVGVLGAPLCMSCLHKLWLRFLKSSYFQWILQY